MENTAEATPAQRRELARLIVTASLTYEEASRMIVGLRRERSPLPPQATIDRLHRALEDGDKAEAGRVLAAAKRQTRHGCWLPLLSNLGIHERQARRLMAAVNPQPKERKDE